MKTACIGRQPQNIKYKISQHLFDIKNYWGSTKFRQSQFWGSNFCLLSIFFWGQHLYGCQKKCCVKLVWAQQLSGVNKFGGCRLFEGQNFLEVIIFWVSTILADKFFRGQICGSKIFGGRIFWGSKFVGGKNSLGMNICWE
jgi:hypothetical protein